MRILPKSRRELAQHSIYFRTFLRSLHFLGLLACLHDLRDLLPRDDPLLRPLLPLQVLVGLEGAAEVEHGAAAALAKNGGEKVLFCGFEL